MQAIPLYLDAPVDLVEGRGDPDTGVQLEDSDAQGPLEPRAVQLERRVRESGCGECPLEGDARITGQVGIRNLGKRPAGSRLMGQMSSGRKQLRTRVRAVDEAFDDMPDLVSISAEVMSVPAMKSALDLPWNRAPGEVEDQLKLMVSAPSVPMATVLERLKSSFRILEINDRPRRGSEARRMALVCLIPVHLAPPSWDGIAGRPVALTVEIAARK